MSGLEDIEIESKVESGDGLTTRLGTLSLGLQENQKMIRIWPLTMVLVSGMMANEDLVIGENYLHDKHEYNKTQKVILESLEDQRGRRAFRIIHATPIPKKFIVK